MNPSDLPQPLPADADGGMRLGFAIAACVYLHWLIATGVFLSAWLLDQPAWLFLAGWVCRSALVQIQPRTSHFTRYFDAARRAVIESN